MGTKDKLFLLISRLTASEKGYVNKHLKSSNPRSNLLMLYVLIGKFKPNEEADLRKRIKETYLLKNLAVTKKQLFDRILKILRDYHANRGELRILLSMIEDIEFLFEKGIVDECNKMIKKAMGICNKFEFYGFKLHLLDWEKRMINIDYYNHNSEDRILKLDEASRQTTKQAALVNELEFKNLLFYNNFFHEKWSEDKEKLDHYTGELANYLSHLESGTEVLTNRLKIPISGLSARLAFFGDSELAFKRLYKEAYLTVGKLNPLTIENQQKILLTKLGLSANRADKTFFENALGEIETLHKNYPTLKRNNHGEMIVLTHQLQFCYFSGAAYDEKKAKRLDKFLDIYAEKIPHGAWMSFHLARYYFTYGQYELAYSMNIKTLSQPQRHIRHFEYICKFFSLMILLELQRYNAIKRAIQDLRRYLKRIERQTSFDMAMIAFFKKAENNWGRKDQMTIHEGFENMTSLYEEEINFEFYYLEIPIWLKAAEKQMTMATYKRTLA